jgi:hypothetical protein
MSDPGTTVRVVIRCDEGRLIEYVAGHGDGARLALRDAPDVGAALAALQRAATAICEIPHPDEPGAPLPNWCDAFLVEGEPVLHLDVQDWGQTYATRIIGAVVTSLSTADLDGRLEPFPWPSPPFEYAAGADIFYGLADTLWELDERGLPPGFPSGFPVPAGCPLVIAQQGRNDSWEHAAWQRRASQPPFEGYLEDLRLFGCVLERVPGQRSQGKGGTYGYRFTHPLGHGSVWLHHQWPGEVRGGELPAWYVNVVWQRAGTGSGEPLPEPFLGL